MFLDPSLTSMALIVEEITSREFNIESITEETAWPTVEGTGCASQNAFSTSRHHNACPDDSALSFVQGMNNLQRVHSRGTRDIVGLRIDNDGSDDAKMLDNDLGNLKRLKHLSNLQLTHVVVSSEALVNFIQRHEMSLQHLVMEGVILPQEVDVQSDPHQVKKAVLYALSECRDLMSLTIAEMAELTLEVTTVPLIPYRTCSFLEPGTH